MSESRYDIYFQGDLLDGFYRDFVQADMAQLFKANPTKIEAFFSGTPQPVKLKVDKPTAARYKMALENIGARPIIVPTGTVPPDRTAVRKKPQIEGNTGTSDDTAAESGHVTASGPADEGDWSVLPAGSDIGEGTAFTPAAIDTSHFSIAQAGATLVEHPNRAQPVRIDISRLTLDEPGATLAERDRSAPPQAPDTSHLSLK